MTTSLAKLPLGFRYAFFTMNRNSCGEMQMITWHYTFSLGVFTTPARLHDAIEEQHRMQVSALKASTMITSACYKKWEVHFTLPMKPNFPA